MSIRTHSIAGLLCAIAPAAHALSDPAVGTQEGAFFRAYYLQHEQGDLEGALALYEEAAATGPSTERVRAAAAAAALAEDLISADFARLMPTDAILYAELMQPGEALSGFVAQLGLLGSLDGGPERYRISPLLISSLLGLRGAAVAVTEVDMHGGPPEFVAIFHPGDLDVVRGLIESAVLMGGTPVDPIGSLPTWSLEGEALLTLTSKLVLVSTSRTQIEGVVRRLQGHESSSLATNPALQAAMCTRGDDLAFVCLNAEPVLPVLRKLLNQYATGDVGAAMAVTMMDIPSLRTLAASLRLGAEGLSLELALDLAEGHHNMAFHMLRKPGLQKRTFELVPDEVAFFLAASLNAAQVASPVALTSAEEPVVTAMDFGRELFGNIIDVALFGLPPETGSCAQIPDVAAIVRVNDPARSRALWKVILGMLAQAGASSTIEPEALQIAGEAAERYEFDGVSVYLLTIGDEMIVSPSVNAIRHLLDARARGRSVLDDPMFAAPLGELPHSSTLAFLCSPARSARLAQPHLSERERCGVMTVASLLDATLVSLRVEHSNTRIAVRVALEGVPDVSRVLGEFVDAQRAQVAGHAAHLGHAGHASDH